MNNSATSDQARLHAYVDGQLSVDARHEVEAVLTNNPEALEQVRDYQQINDLLRQFYDPILEEPVPSTMLAPKRFKNLRWLYIQAAAAVLLLSIGLFGGFFLGLNQELVPITVDSESDHVVAEAVMAYTVYTPEVHHPVEVSGDQREHLVGWLSKRMGRKIIAPHLEPLNMQLLGGRLISSDDGPGALLMYEDPYGHRIIIYACHSDEKSSAFHYAEQQGVSVFYWVDSDISYAIAGEMEREKLQPLAESVYDQLIL
ncbi:MAG: anti-sigma factor [Candidatus Thiodiazotropha sp. (ex. Lucinoma kazani)]